MLLKRGIDKSYIDHTSDIAGVKGKLEMSQTLKSNLLFKQRTICTFDEFSANILSKRAEKGSYFFERGCRKAIKKFRYSYCKREFYKSIQTCKVNVSST